MKLLKSVIWQQKKCWPTETMSFFYAKNKIKQNKMSSLIYDFFSLPKSPLRTSPSIDHELSTIKMLTKQFHHKISLMVQLEPPCPAYSTRDLKNLSAFQLKKQWMSKTFQDIEIYPHLSEKTESSVQNVTIHCAIWK